MASYTWRTVISRRREWSVPAAPPWGASWEEISKAVTAAWAQFREDHRLADDALMSGDFARFHPADEERRRLWNRWEHADKAAAQAARETGDAHA